MGLDTVEILMCWEETFQINIPDGDAAVMETPRQAISYLCSRLDAADAASACPTLQKFNRLRHSICQVTGASRREVRPSVDVRCFYQYVPQREFWQRMMPGFGPAPIQAPGWFSSTTTVGDIVDQLLMCPLSQGERWTKPRVRAAVRAAVRQYVGRRFHDDEHFIRDLGLD